MTLHTPSFRARGAGLAGVLILAAALPPAKAQPPAPSWRAGTAGVTITPEKPMWMTGYGFRDHPATGKRTELWAKALALEDPAGREAVLITLDLCGLPRSLSDRIAEELSERHGIPRRSVIVNASHTHSGPTIEGYILAQHDFTADQWADIVAYRQELELKLIRIAEEALDRLAPAELSWDVDSADFAVNRRNNIEKAVPALRAAGKLQGPVDFDVPILAVRSPGGALAAVVVSYSCHNTTLNGYDWDADYAGYAETEIERRHPGAAALFVQGCGGNINPLPRRQVEEARDYGRRLADSVDRGLAKPMQPVRGEFGSAFEDIDLPFGRRPTLEELRAASVSKTAADRNWAKYLLRQLKQAGELQMSYRYPVQAWRLGGLSWVVLGGEVVVDYELRIQRECRSPVWVFGYSNDVMAYIPSESILAEDATGVRAQGSLRGYEGNASMLGYGRPSPWAPGLEDKIVAAAHRVLDEANGR